MEKFKNLIAKEPSKWLENAKARNSIRERAKKVPKWIKIKVSIRMFLNKAYHYIITNSFGRA